MISTKRIWPVISRLNPRNWYYHKLLRTIVAYATIVADSLFVVTAYHYLSAYWNHEIYFSTLRSALLWMLIVRCSLSWAYRRFSTCPQCKTTFSCASTSYTCGNCRTELCQADNNTQNAHERIVDYRRMYLIGTFSFIGIFTVWSVLWLALPKWAPEHVLNYSPSSAHCLHTMYFNDPYLCITKRGTRNRLIRKNFDWGHYTIIKQRFPDEFKQHLEQALINSDDIVESRFKLHLYAYLVSGTYDGPNKSIMSHLAKYNDTIINHQLTWFDNEVP